MYLLPAQITRTWLYQHHWPSRPATVMIYDNDWTYAEGAMLQDHADLVRAVSADLRAVADKLEVKAVELEDQAHCCRKRRFKRSQSPTGSDSTWTRTDRNTQQTDLQVRSSAASYTSARIIRDHVKSINSAIDQGGQKSPKADPSLVQHAAAPTVLDACSMITDRFAERLVQENKRRKTQSAKPLSIHQKYVNENGLPIYPSPERDQMGMDTDDCWTAVNRQVHKCPTNTKYTAPAQTPADRAADASLLQHVSQQGGVQRSIIMRAANRLTKHEHER